MLQHMWSVHNPPLLTELDLPDRSLAWAVPFSPSHGNEPQDQEIGCGLEALRYLVLRYWREERVSALHLEQYWCTSAFVTLFTWCSEGLEESQVKGWGTPYCRQICLSFQNHDLDEDRAEEKTSLARTARMLLPSLSLQSCPKSENIFMWS